MYRPSQQSVTVPPDRVRVRFVARSAPVATTLPFPAGAVTVTLVSTDTQGLATRLVFPAGVVTATTTVTIAPTTPGAFPAGTRYAAHAFALSAGVGDEADAEMVFARPVAVSIRYSDADAWALTSELELELHRLHGSTWSSARATCDGDVTTTVDGARNVLETVLCRTGTYALFGPTRSVVLPVVIHR